jgi:hypothetical protein
MDDKRFRFVRDDAGIGVSVEHAKGMGRDAPHVMLINLAVRPAIPTVSLRQDSHFGSSASKRQPLSALAQVCRALDTGRRLTI